MIETVHGPWSGAVPSFSLGHWLLVGLVVKLQSGLPFNVGVRGIVKGISLPHLHTD